MYTEKTKLHKRHAKYQAGNLRTIAIDVTAKCNMKCSHCYAETFVNAVPVDLQVLQRALDELYEMGVFHYVLQGGEPIEDMVRLEAILKMCHPDEAYLNVVSNGWKMTPEVIAWLKALKVDKIAFSLDSGIAEEHDARRREGSFERVIQAVDDVLAEGLLTSVSVVVTHQSLYSEGFRKVYKYALDKQIRLDVQIAEPVGKWDGRRDLLITAEDAAYIKQLRSDGPVLSNGQKMVNRDVFSGKEDHCPAGTEFLSITADGKCLPCNFLQYSLGCLADYSVMEMRDALLESNWFSNDHPMCLCGENELFIDEFIMPYVDVTKPLDAYKVFKLKESRRNERV